MRVRGLICSVLMTLTLVGTLVAPAGATLRPSISTVESQAKYYANISRTSRGLPPLRWNTQLRDVARRHSAWMARNDTLQHNSRLRYQVMSFRLLGENVGVGPSMKSIHQALIRSPGHRRNLLGPYTLAGFGAAVTGNEIWITQVFLTPR